MTRATLRFRARIPADLMLRLAADAAANDRTTTAEIVARLEAGYSPAPLTAAQLAEALSCFWNAAIGEARNRQSDTAMNVASVMAEGFAAISARLNEFGGAS